ncbi:MAG: WYL domain-containing protein [Actinomycetota bacterium]|nr:WYL domain-containing protein [Actinomycetota bacterium]
MDRIRRLINLTAYLLDSNKPVELEELRDTVYKEHVKSEKSFKRMFERDKEELRENGIEVELVKDVWGDEAGYTISKEKYNLPEIEFEPAETVSLMMVSRLFLGSGTPFSVPAHTALLKLGFDRKIDFENIPHFRWVDPPRLSTILEPILDGLQRKKLLRFSYRALDSSEPLEREVEPYGLFSHRGFWYLVGRCHLRGEVRSFKLDRIISDVEVNRLSPKKPDFEIPSDFDIEREAKWEWPLPVGEEDIVARVYFSPQISSFHSSGPIVPVSSKLLKRGGIEAVYEVADPEHFVEWVLEFGPEAKILSPPELVNMLTERVRSFLKSIG